MPDIPARTAFIVDDNFHNRKVARIALENIGFHVEEAEDSVVANNILLHRSFNLLVLDLQMPHLTGNVILQNIGELAIHKGMRIVVMTANPHMADDNIQDKADVVLLKPYDIQEFQTLVHKISVSSQFFQSLPGN